MSNKNSSDKIVFITGTPGVGKTTMALELIKRLSKNFDSKLIKINELAIENGLIEGEDLEKGYKIVNITELNEKLHEVLDSFFKAENNFQHDYNKGSNVLKSKIAIIEGHLSHLCDKCDKVIVLRLDPIILKTRLESRKYGKSKTYENLEAEALGVCSVESFEKHGDKVNEINTSHMTKDNVLDIIEDVLFDNKSLPIGEIDFLDWILS
ncbi:putative kinase [Methanobrevibacter cuticularis]|uniref:Putative adenylate kinase n=1 Tax=Methanobrevibacter cuticularis TaxID=47311 RepID=A0A166EKF1_9EURY|nr:adenylate kinase family protein [Methanobrevibacter cuticularis]KZX16755.1 putative kinase [Methanobrevibacter cuticularis]